jgi:hypothetical protein
VSIATWFPRLPPSGALAPGPRARKDPVTAARIDMVDRHPLGNPGSGALPRIAASPGQASPFVSAVRHEPCGAKPAPGSPLWLMRCAATLLLGVACAGPAVAEPVVWLGRFDAGLAPWAELRFVQNRPANAWALRRWDGQDALEVRSEASMSLMARTVTLDLAKTPVLCWRWRVERVLERGDLTRKAGDDQAARIYLGLALPPESLGLGDRMALSLARSRFGPAVPDAAINYVWDNRQPAGSEHPNAYTGRTTMIVKRSGAAEAGRWVAERHDVAADIRRLHGPGARVVQLAVAADTDDTGEKAHSGFAALHAVAADEPCR